MDKGGLEVDLHSPRLSARQSAREVITPELKARLDEIKERAVDGEGVSESTETP
jgi:hypothetical protein